MNLSRRVFALGLGATGLAGCAVSTPGKAPARQAPAQDLQPVANPGYDTWVMNFRSRALRQGIAETTLRDGFRGTGFLPGVVRRDRNQTEFKRSLEDYLSIAVSDERVSKGRAALATHRSVLAGIEDVYGVDPTVVTAIWGLESFYGARRGHVPVVSATSTLAYDGRRGAFFERQLVAALRILQNGDITADKLTGSWAGAMGHTQFIPTSYEAFAVDFTGDGRRDIWSDDPTDALASAAAYLAKNGWTKGQKWGREITPGTQSAALQPQPGGPAFAVNSNFRVIKRYNNSDAYALGVGHLADRIGGAGPLRTAFPPDENGLTKDDRIALQAALTRRGFDTGGVDGVIGPGTQSAIRAYQTHRGLAPTGVPSRALLAELR